MLEQHIDGIIDKTDVVLMAAAEEFEQQFARGGVNRRELQDFLNRMETQLPELNRSMVIDARGKVIYHTGTGTLGNVSDGEFFQQLRKQQGSGLYPSRPIKSRINGRRVVICAQDKSGRWYLCRNRLRCVLPELLSPALLLHQRRSARHHCSARRGHGVIARYPEPASTGRTIGQKKISGEMADLMRTGKEEGTFKTSPPIDNIERAYSYRRSNAYPLNIVVGLASSDYMKEWRAEIAK